MHEDGMDLSATQAGGPDDDGAFNGHKYHARLREVGQRFRRERGFHLGKKVLRVVPRFEVLNVEEIRSLTPAASALSNGLMWAAKGC